MSVELKLAPTQLNLVRELFNSPEHQTAFDKGILIPNAHFMAKFNPKLPNFPLQEDCGFDVAYFQGGDIKASADFNVPIQPLDLLDHTANPYEVLQKIGFPDEYYQIARALLPYRMDSDKIMTVNTTISLLARMAGYPAIYQAYSHEGQVQYFSPKVKPSTIIAIQRTGQILCTNNNRYHNPIGRYPATAVLNQGNTTILTSRKPEDIEFVANSGFAKAVQEAQASLK